MLREQDVILREEDEMGRMVERVQQKPRNTIRLTGSTLMNLSW